MIARNDRIIGTSAIVAAVVGLVMIATGCSMISSPGVAGLPSGLRAVGGGLTIKWTAPTEGTVYLVEKTSSKIVETRSLAKGEPYEFEVDPDRGTETFQKAIGTKLGDAQLVLYFKPASQRK